MCPVILTGCRDALQMLRLAAVASGCVSVGYHLRPHPRRRWAMRRAAPKHEQQLEGECCELCRRNHNTQRTVTYCKISS